MSDQQIQMSGLFETERMLRGDFMGQQRNDDPILKARGGDLCQHYAPLLQDSQVFSVLQQRASQTLSRGVVVTPADDSAVAAEVADAVRELLQREEIRTAQRQLLLNGLLYGFVAAEILWGVGDGGFQVENLLVRNPSRFVYTKDDRLALRRTGQLGHVDLPPEKFVVLRFGALDADSPYGRGLGYQLFWPVQFKNLMLKWQAKGGERFGVPSLVVKYPNNSTEETKQAAFQAIKAIGNSSQIAVPEGMAVEFIQMTGKGDVFDSALDRYDAAISKVVLTQTMTSDDGSSQSQAKVHQEMLENLGREDSQILMSAIEGQLIARYVAANWPSAGVPKVRRDWEAAEDLNIIAERDVRLATLGIERKPDRVAAVYGDDYQAVDTEPDQDRANKGAKTGQEGYKANFAEDWQERRSMPLVNAVSRLDEMGRQALGFEDFEARLPKLFRDEPDQWLLDSLRRAILNGYLAGAAGVENIHELMLDVRDANFTDSDGVDYFSLPDQAAIEYLKGKGYRYSFHSGDWYGEAHARAFTVAKMIDLDLLGETRVELQKALSAGTGFAEFRDSLTPKMQKRGWWGERAVISPDTGEVIRAQLGSNARLETIFRTNINTAHAQSQWQRIQATKADLPYLQYHTVGDGRVRDQHAAWDGLVLPVKDGFWKTHYPPNGYRCRCWVQQLSADQLESRGLEVGQSPSVGYRSVKGRRVPEGIDPSFDHNVGIAARSAPELQDIAQKAYQDPSVHDVDWWRRFGADLPEKVVSNNKRPPLLAKADNAADAWGNWLDAADLPRSKNSIKIIDVLGVEVLLNQKLVGHLRGDDIPNTVADAQKKRDVKAAEERDRRYHSIVETIQNPDEVWLVPDSETGQKLRQRYLKRFGKSGQILVIERDRSGYLAITSFSQRGKFDSLRKGYPILWQATDQEE